MKLSKVNVSEQQLEDLVRRHTGLIEEGLVYLDHQKKAAGGRLDVLMVDSGKALIIAELKVEPDDGMLFQGLDYYDDVVAHIETYARLYEGQIDVTQEVRMFLIAPSFSQVLLNRCKWLKLPTSLFTFSCVRSDQNDEPVPSFPEQLFPTGKEPPVDPPTVTAHLDYITDASVRSKAATLLKEIKTWREGHIVQDAISWGISMKVDGGVFAYLGTRRKHFQIQVYSPEGEWTSYAIYGEDDLAKVKPLIKASMEKKRK